MSRFEHPFAADPRSRWSGSLWALLITLLVHVSVLLLLPPEWLRMQNLQQRADSAQLELALLAAQPPDPAQLRFVEANPQAPENVPDRSDHYSFRNQQAAAPSPSEGLLAAPQIDGEADSQKIVPGAQPAPPPTPGLYAPPAPPGSGDGADGGAAGARAAAAVPPAPPLPPAPAFIQQQPISATGPGSRLTAPGAAREDLAQADPDAPIQVYQPAAPAPLAERGDGAGGVEASRPKPRPRPRLAAELLQGPLMRSRGAVSRRGSLAIDATFSEFGEYQQQFYAALQAGWYQEIEFFQPIDTSTRVLVAFRIQADGSIHDIEVLHSTASEVATIICENALSKRSPFRPWTREMIEVFGTERTLRVVFHYR